MGTRYNRLAEAVLTSTLNLRFDQKFEKDQSFLSENFQFLEVKFSIYLNRRVFVIFFTKTPFCYNRCVQILRWKSPFQKFRSESVILYNILRILKLAAP